VAALQNLTGLTSLALQGNQITDVTPLQNLTALTTLNLASNNLVDIPPASGFFPGDTTRVTPLADLTSLTFLDLSGNGIKEVRALGILTSLSTLVLSDNPDLFCYEVDDLQIDLEGTGITATNCATTYNLTGTVYDGSVNPEVAVGAGEATVQAFIPGGPSTSDTTDASGFYQLVDVDQLANNITVSGLGASFTCVYQDATCFYGLEEINENMTWWLCPPSTACEANSFCINTCDGNCTNLPPECFP
jgi:hypothetical protein